MLKRLKSLKNLRVSIVVILNIYINEASFTIISSLDC